MIHCILGRGQVGLSLAENITDEMIKLYDKGEWEKSIYRDVDVLHVCIPYTSAFDQIIEKALFCFRPKYLIIHSTVKVGTTRKINHEHKLYSPINGRHADDFSKNQLEYLKFFSGDVEAYNAVKDYFKYNCEYWDTNTDQLEYAKIQCTNYMYLNLLYNKVVANECEKNGYDFKKVYDRWNTIYNAGISKNHPTWIRPIYDYQKGEIGGHCLSPNINLHDNFISQVLRIFESTNIK